MTKRYKIYLWNYEYNTFEWLNFKKDIEKDLLLYSTYSILIKISYRDRTEFRMCGSQLGFFIEDQFDYSLFKELYYIIWQRINDSLYSYNLDPLWDLSFIELSVIEHVSLPELKLKNFPKTILGRKVDFPKGLTSKLEVHRNFNFRMVPFTLDTRYYGQVLNLESKKEVLGNISSLFEKSLKLKISLLDKIIESIPNITWEDLINIKNDFYLYKLPFKKVDNNIMGESELDLNTYTQIIVVKIINGYSVKLIFSSKGQIFINLVIDKSIDSQHFERIINNVKVLVEENSHKKNKMVSYYINKKFY